MVKSPLLLVLLCAGSLVADTVVLKDGTKLEGDLRRTDSGWEVRQGNGKTVTVDEDQVASMALGTAKPAGKEEAGDRLESLRKSVAGQSDLNVIIKRYEMFLPQVEQTPVAEEARKDLTLWRDRQANGMVKVRDQWLGQDALRELDAKSTSQLEEARAMLKQGHQGEGAAKVDQVLAEDPENAGALYLKGLILFQQNQVGQARKAFEQVAAAVPTHGPTLNNAAALEWRQRAYVAAMVNYEKAMMAMPLAPRIHDNVAEALNGLPRETRNSAVTKRLAKRYADAEPQLEKAMADEGWYRWGSTWVDEAQLKKLREQEEAIRTKVAELAKQSEETQASIERIDADIEVNNRSMDTMESGRTTRDVNGNIVRLPVPDTWYDRQRDNDRLDAARKQAQKKMELIRREAEQVKSQMAVPPFTGTQKLMDEQFMPVVQRAGKSPTPAATTAPAAQAD